MYKSLEQFLGENPGSRMGTYDIGTVEYNDFLAVREEHEQYRKKVYAAFDEMVELANNYRRERDEALAVVAELKEFRKWSEYYKAEVERIKRDYGFYRQP